MSVNQEYWRGYKQGLRDRKAGTILAAAPYRQWPISQLRRYTAWVRGWAKAYRPVRDAGVPHE